METVSYWSSCAMMRRHRRRLVAGRLFADVTVIGAGLTGILTSYWLIRSNPHLRIILLERDRVGQGASGRSAGMILPRPHIHLEETFGNEAITFTYQKLIEAAQTLRALSALEGFACDVLPTRFLSVALTDGQLRRLSPLAHQYRRFGMQCSVLDAAATSAAIASPRFRGSLEQQGAALLNPVQLLQAMCILLAAAGVQIVEATPAVSVDYSDGCTVKTPAGSVHSSWLIVATPEPLRWNNIAAPNLQPIAQYSFAIMTAPVHRQLHELGWNHHHCVSDMRRVSNYARRYGDRILFGGRMGFHGAYCSNKSVEAVFNKLATELVAWFPILSGVTITHRWRGLLDLSPHCVPVIEQLPPGGRVLRVCGYSGLGIAASIVCSRAIADTVLGQTEQWSNLVYLRAAEARSTVPLRLRTLRERLVVGSGRLRDHVDSVWDVIRGCI